MTSEIVHKPDTIRSIMSLYNALLRSQRKPLRIAGLAALGIGAIPLILLTNSDFDPQESGTLTIANYGLSLVLPVIAALIATNVLANLIEDDLLVYIWMKPTPKWHLAVAAWAVSVTGLLPLVVLPLTFAALLVENGDGVVRGTLVASLLGAAAYSGLFIAMSAHFRRALWVSLGYILVWEGIISNLSDNTARLSVRSYLFSRLEDATRVGELNLADRGAALTFIVPVVVAVVGVAIAGRRLATRDVA